MVRVFEVAASFLAGALQQRDSMKIIHFLLSIVKHAAAFGGVDGI